MYGTHNATTTRKALAHQTLFVTEKEGLIAISVTDRDPARSAALANAYVAALNTKNGALAVSAAGQRSRFFEGQLQAEKTALADAEYALRQKEESSGLVQLNSQASLLLQRVAQVRAQIAGYSVELQSLGGSETPDNPEYQRLKTTIGALQSQLAQLESAPKGQAAGRGVLAASSVPGVGLDYIRLVREVKYHEALLELLARQFTAARLDQARSSPEVQMVDRAEPPDQKSSPHRGLLIIGCTLLGLLLGAAWVLGRAMLAAAASDNRRRAKMDRIAGLFRRDPSFRHE